MRKITALILATIMVAMCFSVAMTASAEDTNLLAGMSYTVGGDATPKDAGTAGADTTPGTLLTDGATRTPEEMNSTGGPVAGKTLEYQGTYKSVSFTFEFDEAVSIAKIVVDGARGWDYVANTSGESAPNRHCNIAKIEVSTDGLNYTEVTYDVAKVAIAGAAQYGATAPEDQFWTITATLATTAAEVSGLRVTLDTTRDDGTNAYIVQCDELAAYGPAAEETTTSESTTESVAESESASESVAESESASESVAESESESASSDDASSEDEVIVAPITYTLTFTYDEEGNVVLTITLPEGTASGKIMFSVSADLTYVAGSLENALSGVKNDAANGSYVLNYAGTSVVPEGTVLGSAKFTLAEGAELDASDITVSVWEVNDASALIGSQEDGICNIVLPTVDDPTSSESESASESVAESESESAPESGSDNPPATGDAGIAVFAVLALVSAAAVVVIKKRA